MTFKEQAYVMLVIAGRTPGDAATEVSRLAVRFCDTHGHIPGPDPNVQAWALQVRRDEERHVLYGRGAAPVRPKPSATACERCGVMCEPERIT